MHHNSNNLPKIKRHGVFKARQDPNDPFGTRTLTSTGSTPTRTSTTSTTTRTVSTPVVTRPTVTTTTGTSTSTPVRQTTDPRTSTTSTTSTTTTILPISTTTTSTPLVNTGAFNTQTLGGTIGTSTGLDTPPSFSMPDASAASAAANNGGGSGDKDSGIGTTTIIGMAAGGIVGLALAFALVSFIVRRCTKKRQDALLGDAFDKADFTRHSVMLPNDDPSPIAASREKDVIGGGRRGPRPPTMIDRHLNRPQQQQQQQQYGGYAGYGSYGQQQQHSYPPSEYSHQQSYGDYHQQGGYGGQQQQYGGQYADQSGYGNHAGYGAYHDAASPMQSPMGDAFPHEATDAAYLNHQVAGVGAGARNLTRRASDELEPPQMHAAQGGQLEHLARGASVTPYQAAQYAEISRRLVGEDASPSVGGTVDAAYARLAREPSPPQGQGQGRAPIRAGAYPARQQQPHQQQRASVYDEADAYGGI